MATTTTTQITPEVNNYYDTLLLKRAVPKFLHMMFGQQRPIPSNSGTKVIKFRRYGNLSAATTPLTESITPGGSSLSATEITATVDQYGDYVTVSDVLDFTSKDAVLTEATEILGDQAGDTLDQLTRDVLAAGTSVLYPGAIVSRVTVTGTDLIDTDMIDRAVRTLKNGEAMPFTPLISASMMINTGAVQPSYWGLVHPDTTFTLQNLNGFQKAKDYASQTAVMPTEVGAYNGVRFIETTNTKIFAGAGAAGIDVYATLIFGKDSYGITDITTQGLMSVRKPFGSAGTADPLDQRATVGWKATHVSEILNDNFMARLEHAA